MTEYEASRGMPADSTIVFDTAADLSLADSWLPSGVHVYDQGDNVVSVDGDQVTGHEHHEGLFRRQPDQLRIEWGGRDHPGYAGWLQVADRADGTSEATLHLSFLDDEVQPVDGDTQALIESSLDRLAQQVGDRLQSG